MKIHRFTLLAALLTSPAFAQNIVIADYLQLTPQNTSGEGGELELLGSNGYGAFRLDNYFGHARIHTLAPGKQFQILGGTIYADGVGAANFFAGNVGIGTTNPGTKLEVGGSFRSTNNSPLPNFGTGLEVFFQPSPELGVVQAVDRANSSHKELRVGPSTYFGANGNVGFGTANPSEKLHVNGVLRVSPYSRDEAGGYPNGHAQLNLLNGNIYQETSSINFGGAYVPEGTRHDVVYNRITWSAGWLKITNNQQTKLQIGGGLEWGRQDVYINPEGGNVGIGTTNPAHKLAVNGTIKAKEIIVETTGWSDYVFADDYRLAPLSEVEAHIKTNKHLPGLPSAAQVAEHGVNLGDVQSALLAKVEELTLHLIAQQKQLSAQQDSMQSLQRENAALISRVHQLEKR